MPRVDVLRELPPPLRTQVRELLDAAFGESFTGDDWRHCLGGWHLVAYGDGGPVAHAALVPRTLHLSGTPVAAGYVEGVATLPAYRRRGLASLLMREVAALLHEHFALGALSTGSHAFYERLGWERWRGATYVRDGSTLVRTADEDDGVMVLRYGASAAFDLSSDLACDARPGDDW